MKNDVNYESMDTFFQILADIKSLPEEDMKNLSKELVDIFDNSSLRKKEEYKKIISKHIRKARNDVRYLIDLAVELNLVKM